MGDQTSFFMARTKLIHGFGTASLAGQEASRLGISKALLVTDKGVRTSGLLGAIEKSLASCELPFEVFDDVHEDADVESMHRGATLARGINCDGVIAVGGGSSICAGKGIALEASNGEKVSSYEGRNVYSEPPLPVVCLPTTAGSGSDVSAAFVVHDAAQERVYGVAGDDLQPPVSILDPLLLRTCPPRQMIYSGLDALSHCVEAIWTKMATPLTDAIAYESIGLIMGNLRKAALTDDLQAKSLQHLASSMANIACGNSGLGIVHGMTAYYQLKVPHGYQVAMLLPYAMEFNMPACEEKLARMAVAIGERPRNRSARELAELALRRLKELYADLGFPRKFNEDEFPVEDLPRMTKEATEAAGKFLVQNNIRKASEHDLRGLYEAALRGWEM